MQASKTRKAAHGSGERWLLLGASGILQPLSEEFMYRAASVSANHTWRRLGRVGRARADDS